MIFSPPSRACHCVVVLPARTHATQYSLYHRVFAIDSTLKRRIQRKSEGNGQQGAASFGLSHHRADREQPLWYHQLIATPQHSAVLRQAAVVSPAKLYTVPLCCPTRLTRRVYHCALLRRRGLEFEPRATGQDAQVRFVHYYLPQRHWPRRCCAGQRAWDWAAVAP